MVTEPVGAFIERFDLPPTGQGALSGLHFGLKDLVDVAGRVTGCGNPVWADTHGAAGRHAPVLETLLAAGAHCVGKTHTDELAYSLMGANAHYGTPLNPAAPDRVPGGSSSGSASAVAAGSVEFAIGTDTRGSVRLPASFCGLYGLRTTHGRISMEGVAPLAPSFDALGWFARDLDTMGRVAQSYGLRASQRVDGLRMPGDLWSLAEMQTVEALSPAIARLERAIGSANIDPLREADADYGDWREVFRIIQAHEAWRAHGSWIESCDPRFGPGVRERFAAACGISDAEAATARAARDGIRSHVSDAVTGGSIIVIPTSPGPAPMLSADADALDVFRTRALSLLCPAGLAGLPQLSVPVAHSENAPVELSLIGPAGSEGALLEVAALISAAE